MISKADIGVSILPDIPLFNTSTPVKILDYYSSTVPCIMTNNANNNTLFTDDYDAWFCKFNKDSIKEKSNISSLYQKRMWHRLVKGVKKDFLRLETIKELQLI